MPGSAALFGNATSRNQSKNLVEFKAGKMVMKGKMVHPDKRKGLLYVYQSDDSLMHFCWKDRTTGTVEDDLIIFPDDCEFKRVEQCTTGRVYVLKFKSSSRKFFFWLQEPKTDKDEENCKKINEMLNNPPTAGSSRSGGTTPDGDLQNLLGSMSQQQLMQLFGSFGTGGAAGQFGGLSNLLGTMNRPNPTSGRTAAHPATTASTPVTTSTAPVDSSARTTAPAAGGSNNRSGAGAFTAITPIQLSDLQKFLSNLTQTPGAQAAPPANVDLSDALNSESIAGVLNDPNLVRELSPHLPNIGGTESTEEQLLSTITSPQFQQGNMEEFVKALQNTSINQDRNEKEDEAKHIEKKKKTESSETEKKDKKDEDDDKMALD
ncbi:UNVERIFIED_CONTAM: hypothetical protein PYX00_010228 [Menopon gallinae]|uniref:Proteasomal ubiquitin receptor ADRM1 homolog n=1 Tax=Menopon gallinae TaxID=328185 RepID=A0AAW2HF05_9NEOP